MKLERLYEPSSFGFVSILQLEGVDGITKISCNLYFEVCCCCRQGSFNLSIFSSVPPLSLSHMLLTMKGGSSP
jgi:hypothetical protein